MTMNKFGICLIAVFGTVYVLTYVSAEPIKTRKTNNCPKPPSDGSFYANQNCEGVRLINGQKCPCKCRGATNTAAAGWYCPSSAAPSTTPSGATTTTAGGATTTTTTGGSTTATTTGGSTTATTTGGSTTATTTGGSTTASTTASTTTTAATTAAP